ncbi:MAG: hypothetical protein MUP33_13350 [Polaromonas sp.]|nr:hypothetical protein [Polaromonas sp.]
MLGLRVEHAQHAQCIAIGANELGAPVKANAQRFEHRIVLKALVGLGIGHFKKGSLQDTVPADAVAANSLFERKAELRLEPLPVQVDERDGPKGGSADRGGGLRDVIERIVGGCVKHLVAVKFLESLGLAGWDGSGEHEARKPLLGFVNRLPDFSSFLIHAIDKAPGL